LPAKTSLLVNNDVAYSLFNSSVKALTTFVQNNSSFAHFPVSNPALVAEFPMDKNSSQNLLEKKTFILRYVHLIYFCGELLGWKCCLTEEYSFLLLDDVTIASIISAFLLLLMPQTAKLH
jgi:hypothetical protein